MHEPVVRTTAQPYRRVGWALVYLAVVAFVVSVGAGTAWLGAGATALLCVGLLAIDAPRRGLFTGFTPITMYIIGSGLAAAANMRGLLSRGTDLEFRYFLYAVERHLDLAMYIGFIGTLFPVLGFWMARGTRLRAIGRSLPRLSGRMRPRTVMMGLPLGVGLILGRVLSLVPSSLGALASVFWMGPTMIVFAMARIGSRSGNRSVCWAALVLAFLDAARAAVFSYVRIEVALPIFAFSLGMVLGAGSLRPLRSTLFAPIWAAALVFVLFFGAFGAVRAGFEGGGLQRLSAVIEARSSLDPNQKRTIFARLTTFNQLSQVGRVAEEDGFQKGGTLSYLSYAFIPRVIWPDKPVIAMGSWFAQRIGLGGRRPDGSWSNAVNMTVPGELYLNFGWVGLMIGGLLVGLIVAWLWEATGFWREHSGALASGFGFYLLFVSFGLGADLQTLVTLVAMYILFAGLGALVSLVRGGGRRGLDGVRAAGQATEALRGEMGWQR